MRPTFSTRLQSGQRAGRGARSDEISSLSGHGGSRATSSTSWSRRATSKRNYTFTLLQSVAVLATGSQADSEARDAEGQPRATPPSRSTPLPDDAKRVIAAREIGHVTALLRAPGDLAAVSGAITEARSLLGLPAGRRTTASASVPVIYGGGPITEGLSPCRGPEDLSNAAPRPRTEAGTAHRHQPHLSTASRPPRNPLRDAPTVSDHLPAPRPFRQLLLCLTALLPCACAVTLAVDPVELTMFEGETRVIPEPNAGRLADGNGQVLSAAVLDDREILLIANKVGIRRCTSGPSKGRNRRVKITVVPADTPRVNREIAAFIAGIPNARSSVIGDKVVVEGDGLSNRDQARIEEFAKRYPQIINFTNPVGWEKMIVMDVQIVEFPINMLREIGLAWNATGGAASGASGCPVGAAMRHCRSTSAPAPRTPRPSSTRTAASARCRSAPASTSCPPSTSV